MPTINSKLGKTKVLQIQEDAYMDIDTKTIEDLTHDWVYFYDKIMASAKLKSWTPQNVKDLLEGIIADVEIEKKFAIQDTQNANSVTARLQAEGKIIASQRAIYKIQEAIRMIAGR